MVGEPAFAGVGVYYGYKDQRSVASRTIVFPVLDVT